MLKNSTSLHSWSRIKVTADTSTMIPSGMARSKATFSAASSACTRASIAFAQRTSASEETIGSSIWTLPNAEARALLAHQVFVIGV